jgi:hypothetical protein
MSECGKTRDLHHFFSFSQIEERMTSSSEVKYFPKIFCLGRNVSCISFNFFFFFFFFWLFDPFQAAIKRPSNP